MKLSEIIDKVSELYRTEISLGNTLRDEYNEVCKKLAKADHERGETITLAEYQYLKARKQYLRTELDFIGRYCAGIEVVRELLMDFRFETEVE
jgi:hypothetical protein